MISVSWIDVHILVQYTCTYSCKLYITFKSGVQQRRNARVNRVKFNERSKVAIKSWISSLRVVRLGRDSSTDFCYFIKRIKLVVVHKPVGERVNPVLHVKYKATWCFNLWPFDPGIPPLDEQYCQQCVNVCRFIKFLCDLYIPPVFGNQMQGH